MCPSFLIDSREFKQGLILVLLSIALSACARISVSTASTLPPDIAIVPDAIKAEPLPPREIVVCDFEFSPSVVLENASPLHRFTDLFRESSAEERRIQIGRDVNAILSDQIVGRVNRAGLWASRISADRGGSVPDDVLLVTGRLFYVNEGDRLTRIALGLGVGESGLDTEVHVFRVALGERAEVLTFTTQANSGEMPGLIPSLTVGFLLAPLAILPAATNITSIFSVTKNAASTGEGIYSSQIDHLASKTGDQIARYLSQYLANKGWIPKSRASSVNLAASYFPLDISATR
jgi:hypothetical protein